MITKLKKKAKNARRHPQQLRVFGCFSGIGGFELAFRRAKHKVVGMCEIDATARHILGKRFPGVPISNDVRKLKALPSCDILVAGWPCQDISQAGRGAGLDGANSGLISEILRLVESAKNRPEFILLENVEFIRYLKKGNILETVLISLNNLGYRTAFRVLDTQDFGVPQRRRRVYILGSLSKDPESILPPGSERGKSAFSKSNITVPVGFYWTEGRTGIGWAVGAVPPLKGGSGLSIPSPPAIWRRDLRDFVLPSISTAERLQGFPKGWTSLSKSLVGENRRRWTLIGNAVSVPVVLEIAKRLRAAMFDQKKISYERSSKESIGKKSIFIDIGQYLDGGESPLSKRAAAGVYRRLLEGKLNVPADFLRDLQAYVEHCGRSRIDAETHTSR